MTNFKVGDKVLFVQQYTTGPIKYGYSDTGTIVEDMRVYNSDGSSYAVCLDHPHSGAYTCYGVIDINYGYFCDARDLTLLSEVRSLVYKKKLKRKKNVLRSLLTTAH